MRKFRLVLIVLALIALFAASNLTSASNTTVSHESTALTGGPDAYGYTFFDEADGCGYDFIDISTTGTLIGSGDDVGFPVALTEAFNFYGTDFTTLAFTSNGYISTDSTDTGPDLSNDCPIPASPSTGGGARIYVLHDDLDLDPNNPGVGEGYVQYFSDCPRDNYPGDSEACTIFMWDDVSHFPGDVAAATWDMEAILYHDNGDIVFQYGTGDSEAGSGATIGIQNFPPPTTALMYGCDTASMYTPGSSAICIRNPNSTAPTPPAADEDEDEAVYVPSAEDNARAQAPLCADMDGSTDEAVRASMSGGEVTGGGVYCRMLDDNMGMMVGNADLMAMHPMHAVDVYGMAGAVSHTSFNSSIEICLAGTGRLAFLDASAMPRSLSWIPTTYSGGYSCGRIYGAGTVVLVP